jgi:hypothetical protein
MVGRNLLTRNADANSLPRYVPRPKPEVFRITKNNHNILQGVDTSGCRLDAEQAQKLDDWCEQNAKRYWTSCTQV